MNTIKHALKKFEKEKGDQKSNESVETAKYSRLSEMEKIKIESINTMEKIGDTITSKFVYRIYTKSEDGCIHRTYIPESMFNLLYNGYKWMVIDKTEHTETDALSGRIRTEINSVMIAVIPNDKDEEE